MLYKITQHIYEKLSQSVTKDNRKRFFKDVMEASSMLEYRKYRNLPEDSKKLAQFIVDEAITK